MMFCNQSTAPVVAPQLMAHSYEARGEGKRALALDIENSGIVLAALIPWNISVSIPLAMLGAGASALPVRGAAVYDPAVLSGDAPPSRAARGEGENMITLLSHLFIKNRDDVTNPAVRRAYGQLCGIVGIALNLVLFVGKFFAGTVSGSVAITADAFNNLSDAGSSVVTLLGFRLAGKKPDPEHPFGHGRMEYVSGLIVAGLILLMGAELAKSSFEKVLHPEAVDFSALTAVILAVSVCVKLYMCLYNRRISRKIDSVAMVATAADSFSDSIATTAVLAAMLVGRFTGLMIDGWVGLVVAVPDPLVGGAGGARYDQPAARPAAEEGVRRGDRTVVMAHEGICGVHDLVVHDYGPGRRMISLHAEVPASGDILEMHDLVDNIEQELSKTLGCQAVIHMDPILTDDAQTNELRARVAALVRGIDEQRRSTISAS